MGYDLASKNNGAFHFGAFSWPVLLEACGYLWPFQSSGGQWYCAFGADPRMPKCDDYPRLMSNDVFEVTAEEALIMARMARNFVAVQRSLSEEKRDETVNSKEDGTYQKEDVTKAMIRGMFGGEAGPWPRKIRTDFVDRFENFADWAEASGGFAVH